MKNFGKGMLLLVCMCAVCACCWRLPSFQARAAALKPATLPPHLRVALAFVGLRETTGPNRSPEIDRWNRFAGAPLGSSYCAAFVSWCLHEANVKAPRLKTAWAKNFVVKGRSRTATDVAAGRYQPQPGDIIIWTRGTGGHVGFCQSWSGQSGRTVEANTSPGAGSQWNGDGVYERSRSLSPFSHFRIVAFTPVEP